MAKFAETTAVAKVEDVARGDYVRKVTKDGLPLNKVYQRGTFDRTTKRYSLIDCDDVNRELFVKKGTKLLVGFTY